MNNSFLGSLIPKNEISLVLSRARLDLPNLAWGNAKTTLTRQKLTVYLAICCPSAPSLVPPLHLLLLKFLDHWLFGRMKKDNVPTEPWTSHEWSNLEKLLYHHICWDGITTHIFIMNRCVGNWLADQKSFHQKEKLGGQIELLNKGQANK